MHATMRMVQRLLGKSRIHNARGSGRHDDIFICHVRQPSISTMHVERGRRISWQPTGVSEASPPYRLMWINSLPPSRICSPPPPPEDGLLLTSAGLAAASSDFLASSLAS